MFTSMHPGPQRDPALNLGTGASSPESRTGSFAHGTAPKAIEPGAGKVLAGVAEDVL